MILRNPYFIYIYHTFIWRLNSINLWLVIIVNKMGFLWLYHTCTWNNIFFTFICYLTWHKVFVITLGLSPSVCYLFTFQSLFTEITVDNRTNLCTNVFGCSFVIFWKFKIVQKHFLWFLEIQNCSETLFVIFRNSKLFLNIISDFWKFKITARPIMLSDWWKFQILLLRSHMYDNN